MQSLLSGYKRINILLNPECSQGYAKAATQYSPPCLSLLYGSTILKLSSLFCFFCSEMEQETRARQRGEDGREGGK